MILKRIIDGPESMSDWMLKRFDRGGVPLAANSHKRNTQFQFWPLNNHAEEVFSEPFMWSKINRAAFRYIHMNPLRAGLVFKASEYLYSSASNYLGKHGLFQFELPSQPIIDLLKKGCHIDIDEW